MRTDFDNKKNSILFPGKGVCGKGPATGLDCFIKYEVLSSFIFGNLFLGKKLAFEMFIFSKFLSIFKL